MLHGRWAPQMLTTLQRHVQRLLQKSMFDFTSPDRSNEGV
jgi:hypothetical protein